MLFNSLHFALFFPVVVLLFFLMRGRLRQWRWLFLLAASYYFYMSWRSEYIFLIVISTFIDFFAAQQIYNAKRTWRRRFWLFTSLAVNLGILFYFKYLTFFTESTTLFFEAIGLNTNLPTVELLLPVGISFYTFQTLSYTVDVYRGDIKPERDLGNFALYVSFFPQLVAGPIERSSSLLPQLRNIVHVDFQYHRVTSGLKLMAWGLFKKVVIADRVAFYVNQVYNNADQYYGLPIIIATFLFAYQIYCDFSGYSDIAIGAARVIGVDLRLNFDRPYFATSIQDFWSRWHISLSTWFRDYVYIPLGGNRTSTGRWHLNIMATFLLSGLWHGANWTFVIWGAIHGGMYIVAYWGAKLLAAMLPSWDVSAASALVQWLHTNVQRVITFIVVCIGWMFFRANDLSDIPIFVNGILDYREGWWSILPNLPVWYSPSEIYLGFALIAFLILVEATDPMVQWAKRIKAAQWWVRLPLYYLLIMSIILLGEFSIPVDFIYFQF